MEKTTIEQCEKTIVALSEWIQEIVVSDYTNQEVDVLPKVVQGLSRLIDAVDQLSFIEMPTAAATTTADELSIVRMAEATKYLKLTRLKQVLGWSQLDQETKDFLLKYAAKKGIAII